MSKVSGGKHPCPICRHQADMWLELGGRDATGITCPQCGEFLVSKSAFATLECRQWNARQKANASGWVREHRRVELSSADIAFLDHLATPSVAERALKILVELERQSADLASRFNFNPTDPAMLPWVSVSWSVNPEEVGYLVVEYLHNLELVGGNVSQSIGRSPILLAAGITPKGYEVLGKLRSGAADSAIGFCAMWFSSDMDPLWAKGMEPAIRQAGFRPMRIDQHEHVNRIDDEIVAMIKRSRFVVADFTGQRGGVYFESGLALGLGLQVIWTCRDDELSAVHFDNRQYNFLTWNANNLMEFARRLSNRIEAVIGRGAVTVDA